MSIPPQKPQKILSLLKLNATTQQTYQKIRQSRIIVGYGYYFNQTAPSTRKPYHGLPKELHLHKKAKSWICPCSRTCGPKTGRPWKRWMIWSKNMSSFWKHNMRRKAFKVAAVAKLWKVNGKKLFSNFCFPLLI